MKLYDGVTNKSTLMPLVTDGIGLYGAKLYLEFTFEEVQRYLVNRGYKFCVIEGNTEVRDTESDGGGSYEYVGKPYKKVFTVFMVYNPDLFDNPGSPYEKLKYDLRDSKVTAMLIDQVFKKEIKKQLLGF